MKKLFVSALMLTGLLATAQEPAKTTQTTKETTTATATTTSAATPVTTAQPAPAATATAQPAATQPATTSDNAKVEAVSKDDKAEAKKANPAKKSK
ncbi:hypothetical protein [Flavobacterium psychrotrophum]|uniref:hypothetical protein n=1 Tax=Flavobacterium psychrotrophum TaxID=2294119 RepID=UPI0013C4890F|nr:hypothetical protein [Flavobacterium psychrotrophum]